MVAELTPPRNFTAFANFDPPSRGGWELFLSDKQGPFSGLLVIDLTRVLAGPYAALIMAELGARVIKIEPPAGDDARRYGPFVTAENGAAKSGYFMSINRGKESIALDLKKEDDR